MHGCVDFHERDYLMWTFVNFIIINYTFMNSSICFSYKSFITSYISTTARIYCVMSMFKFLCYVAELSNKDQEKKILSKKIKKRYEELKSSVGYVAYVVFYHDMNKSINKNGWCSTRKLDAYKKHRKKYEILEIHPQKALSTTFHHIFDQNNKIVVDHLALMRIL